MAGTQAAVLPDSLRRYFWDYDVDRLSWDRSRGLIVTRLLQSGGLDAVSWLREHLGDDELRAFLTTRCGRGIAPRRLRFWGLILGVRPDEVDQWVRAAHGNPWNQRTR